MLDLVPPAPRRQRCYDHRLRQLVHTSGDASVPRALGVPRSTAAGWLKDEPSRVVTLDTLEEDPVLLQAELLALRRRLARVSALCRVLVLVVRLAAGRLDARRLGEAGTTALVRTLERARAHLPVRTMLRVIGVSQATYHAWAGRTGRCAKDEAVRCLRRRPNQLTPAEVHTVRGMVTSPELRHVPTGRLALLAQRLGTVVAAPTTWYRLVRVHGWRRPRLRLHPPKPRVGLRALRPNEAWHVDTTVIRLLDGTKTYVHAVIDNFSRRILAFRVAARFEVGNCVAVLREAVAAARLPEPPTAVVDGGVENFNRGVDELVEAGFLKRIRAQSIELRFSNSLIEAFWRSLKHHWLFLNTLDSVAAVARLVEFYVREHNAVLPHPAFHGQTPDEMYAGTGAGVPAELAAVKAAARAARLEVNRTARCATCARSSPPEADEAA